MDKDTAASHAADLKRAAAQIMALAVATEISGEHAARLKAAAETVFEVAGKIKRLR